MRPLRHDDSRRMTSLAMNIDEAMAHDSYVTLYAVRNSSQHPWTWRGRKGAFLPNLEGRDFRASSHTLRRTESIHPSIHPSLFQSKVHRKYYKISATV